MTDFMESSLESYLNDIWNQVLKDLENNEAFEDGFDIILKGDAVLKRLDEKEAYVIVSEVYMNIFRNKPMTGDILNEAFERVLNRPIHCHVISSNSFMPQQTALLDFADVVDDNIPAEYTFDNFVVGNSNREAHMAAMQCAKDGSKFFNPLFIYGDSGLGKTHLMLAIGNYIKKEYPDKKIQYLSVTDLMDQSHRANKEGKMDEFKEQLNSLDILLMDDIQMLSGKVKTGEFFFQIFNNLVNNRKLIVMTSDKQPNELKGMEDRLISRFSKGLSVVINSPEFETRLNILKMKLKQNRNYDQGLVCDEESLCYIATNCTNDVRTLEGMLNRVMYYSINFSNGETIGYDLTVEALKDILKTKKDKESVLNPNTIIHTVAEYYGLTKKDLLSKSRVKNISTARHIAIYLIRELLDVPYKKIGTLFDGMNHATIIAACNKIDSFYRTDEAYKTAIDNLKLQLRNK
ncbi:MAG: chromosomal replication initiator protein DnaA [Erysipelotrichaceae bacterium]|nr:chromosomal replication initiator protein DnaA [Erysipelotrichaceae bacterium]